MADAKQLRVLLVEDNDMNLDMLTRRLVRSGYSVVQATDGEQAVVRAGDVLPDIVLMDVGLPKLSGLDAIRRLREDPKTRDLKIIALTAHALSGDRETVMEAGADDYATKPVNFKELAAKITDLIGVES